MCQGQQSLNKLSSALHLPEQVEKGNSGMAIRLQELPALLLWRHDHNLPTGLTAELEGS